jgi:hypothetical protein
VLIRSYILFEMLQVCAYTVILSVLGALSSRVVAAASSVAHLETFGVKGLHISGSKSASSVYVTAAIGDFNGDGIGDYVVGFPTGSASGTAFIVIGGETLHFDPSSFTSGHGGMKILGGREKDHFGSSVGVVGDINGDGLSDCLIGAPGVETSLKDDVGAIYVVFGKAGPYEDMHMSGFNAGIMGYAIIGEVSGARLGLYMSSLNGAIGDVNGDGVDDFAIGSPNDHVDTATGAVYVIYGKSDADEVANIDLGYDLGSTGVKITGAAAGDHMGFAVSGAGDVNGDGIRDLLIGCPGAAPHDRASAGTAYLIYSSRDMADVKLAEFETGEAGVKIIGAATAHKLGATVSNAADLNGDGLADLVLGAPGTHTDLGHDVGCVHVVYGTTAAFDADVDLADLEAGSAGFTICGEEMGAKLGTAVAHAGDVNQDGIDDVLVSTADHDGSVYVIYGDASVPEGDINLAADADYCYVLANGESAVSDEPFSADMMLESRQTDAAPLLGGTVRVKAGATYTLDCGPAPVPQPVPAPQPSPTHAPVSTPTRYGARPSVSPSLHCFLFP